MSAESQQAREFTTAAEAFVGLVHDISPDAWERPALGVWSVRELVGHTSRALTTVPAYLDSPAETVDVEDPAGYFMAVLQTTSHEQVAERGRVSARGLGADPAHTVRQQARTAIEAVAHSGESALVQTPAGGMRLLDYLPTRTYELTVHSLDLLRATGMRAHLPAEAVAAATRLAVDLAAAQGKAVEVLLALNHRQPLDSGFGVL